MSRRALSLVSIAVLLLLNASSALAAEPVAGRVSVTADVPELSVGAVRCDPRPYDPTLGPADVWFTLSRPASALLVVTDMLRVTRWITSVPYGTAGRNDVVWNGTSDMGSRVSASWYTLTVTAAQVDMTAQKSATIAVSYGAPLVMTAKGVKPATLAPPGTATFSVAVSRDAYVSAVVRDSRGKVVRSSPAVLWFAGTGGWTWDGKDDKGTTVANGTYGCTLNGTDSGGAVRTITQSVAVRRK